MRIARQAAIGAAILTAGCSSMNTAADMPAPDPRAVILAHKNTLWKDPESIKNASITEPFRNTIFSMNWLVCVRANARNSFGGYTGESDTLIALNSPPEVLHERAVGACGDKPRSNFAELNGDYRPAQARR